MQISPVSTTKALKAVFGERHVGPAQAPLALVFAAVDVVPAHLQVNVAVDNLVDDVVDVVVDGKEAHHLARAQPLRGLRRFWRRRRHVVDTGAVVAADAVAATRHRRHGAVLVARRRRRRYAEPVALLRRGSRGSGGLSQRQWQRSAFASIGDGSGGRQRLSRPARRPRRPRTARALSASGALH